MNLTLSLEENKNKSYFQYLKTTYNMENKTPFSYYLIPKSFIGTFLKLSKPEQKLLLVLARFAINNKVNNITNEMLIYYCGWKNTSHISSYLKQLQSKKLISIQRNKNPKNLKKNLPNTIYFDGNFQPSTPPNDKTACIFIQYKLFDMGVIAKWTHIELKLYIYLSQFTKVWDEIEFFNQNVKTFYFRMARIIKIPYLQKILKVDTRTLKTFLNKKSFNVGDGYFLLDDKIIFINYKIFAKDKEDMKEDIELYLENIADICDDYDVTFNEVTNRISDVFWHKK